MEQTTQNKNKEKLDIIKQKTKEFILIIKQKALDAVKISTELSIKGAENVCYFV